MIFRVIMIVTALQLCGCYYLQAATGQMEIVRKREPIDEILVAGETPPELGERLKLVAAARQFSIDVLGLPDNDSYRSYADLDRDFVVWNVIAVPEFSLHARKWCYPIVGCVSYRGYFSKAAAERKANSLRRDGYDIAFGGVAAYSTLGRFADPILNTMMHWGDADLVAVMFHELAHQLLYVKDDTGFNESFATAVEEAGMQRWLRSRDQPEALAAWQARRDLRSRFATLVADARVDLEELYRRPISDAAKRQGKQLRLQALAGDAERLFTEANMTPPAWLAEELNNARIVSTTLYHGRLPEFRALLEQCDDDLPCFYKAARTLADST